MQTTLATRLGRRIALAAALAAGFALTLPEPAAACGNEMFRVQDENVPKLDMADRLLVSGKTRGALRLAATVGRNVRGPSWTRVRARTADPRPFVRAPGDTRLAERAVFTAAVATVRLQGKVTLPRGRRALGLGEGERLENLRWAAEVLEAQAKANASPRNQARLAEAHAAMADGDGEDRALELLSKLEERDLMPDAHAYALLAKLHDIRGETEARDEALETCEQRAGRLQQRICPRFAPSSRTVAKKGDSSPNS